MTIRCSLILRALSRPISERMDTVQIRYTLKDVISFLGVYPSYLLPRSIVQTGSVIVNTDPHTEEGSQWLAIHFQPKSSSAFHFDSYGNPASVPDIKDFIRRCCTVCHYNTVRFQGATTTLCGHYCCLFVLYTDMGYTPQQFVALFNADIADREVERLFASEFGGGPAARCAHRGGRQCCTSLNKS
jgi:hypothetical protein